ncbi:hypothetical protein BJX76DRAFT_342142 [Aspergillus varians]
MPFFIYSLGLVAALAGLVQALPTPTTPSTEDLTSGVPEIPSSAGSGSDSNVDGSSFMGIALSHDVDLGNLEELPTSSTDLIIGSLQNVSNHREGDVEDSSDDDSDDEDDN